jgi:hypothetical protein
MYGISELSKGIQCPARLVFYLNENNYPPRDKRSSSEKSNSSNLTKDTSLDAKTKGKIFESAIQYLMVKSNLSNRKSFYSEIYQWFLSTVKESGNNSGGLSLKESEPIWPLKWMEEKMQNQILTKKDWFDLKNDFKKVKMLLEKDPWGAEGIEWSREEWVDEIVTIAGIKVQVCGFIDIYGDGGNIRHIIELKKTNPNALRAAQAQASLYVKAIEKQYPDNSTIGFVYHSHGKKLDPIKDEEWEDMYRIGEENIEKSYISNKYNCQNCRNLKCPERFIE